MDSSLVTGWYYSDFSLHEGQIFQQNIFEEGFSQTTKYFDLTTFEKSNILGAILPLKICQKIYNKSGQRFPLAG